MEDENSPPPSPLYNGPPLSWSEPTIEFHDKYFFAELKVKSSDSLTDMPNFRLLIYPVRFFGKKKEKQKTTTTIMTKKKNKQTYKQKLFLPFVLFDSLIQIFIDFPLCKGELI